MAIITSKKTYKDGDIVEASLINDLQDTVIDSNEKSNKAYKLTNKPNTANANNIGTPNVFVGEDGRLVFENLKGATGEKGDTGVSVSNVKFNTNDYTMTITLSNGSSYTSGSLRGEKGESGMAQVWELLYSGASTSINRTFKGLGLIRVNVTRYFGDDEDEWQDFYSIWFIVSLGEYGIYFQKETQYGDKIEIHTSTNMVSLGYKFGTSSAYSTEAYIVSIHRLT